MNFKEFDTQVNGIDLKVKFSEMAKMANGSLLAQLGDTLVLATVVAGKEDKLDSDFMPLTVDYEEKYYAAGKIFGSRFVRRESRPTENAVLTGRLIDRTLRPLFNDRIRRDIQVIITCLSIDEANDPDVSSVLAASLVLLTSNVPWGGPVSAIRIGWSKEGGFKINPNYTDRLGLDLDLMVSGTKEKINMIEAEGKQIPEDIVVQAFELGQKEITKLCEFQEKVALEYSKPKMVLALQEMEESLVTEIKTTIGDRLETILFDATKTKQEKDSLLSEFNKTLKTELIAKGVEEAKLKLLNLCLEEITNDLLHSNLLEKNRRPDGRKTNEIRPIDILLDVLPRTHGSALFVRGDTQVLSVTTLGAPKETLTIQGMEISEEKRYMHHYNFPGYSVGELNKGRGGQNRREIGHGALAEKAVRQVVPGKADFPYTIRVVSEVLSSNGSSSMASTCGSTLSLMTAGVPITAPIAGIAMGIISNKDKYVILTDIQGPEDHYGDMDFKVTGSKDGITALQMDVKIDGVTPSILKEALDQAKEARLFLLDKINTAISEPRKEVSQYAPKIVTFMIDSTRIGEVIGSGGKMINKITEETGTEINFDDDGTVYITGPEKEAIEKAKAIVEGIVRTFVEGEVVEGTVMELKDFGAIIDLGAYQSGLLHISELKPERVEKVEDVVKLGDKLKLKVKNVENGKISLSLRDITHPDAPRQDRPRFERGGSGGGFGRKPGFRDHR